MAYPTIDKPYGLKPINLLGGQVFSGSTRNYPIQYGYASNIFYGDIVNIVRGTIVKNTSTTSATGVGLVGVFLGCSFTNPLTGQKQFQQYWPASTLAGDCDAIVCDDPDTVFKVAVCSATTTIASASVAMLGQNYGLIQNAGSTTTGNSAVSLLYSATLTTAAFPCRVVGLVEDSAYSYTGTGSTSSTTLTLTGTGLSGASLTGADVAYVAANGQIIGTGSFLTGAIASGGTSGTLNVAVAVPGSVTDIPSASTVIVTMYPEVLVKLNFAVHSYYTATAV